MLKSFLISSLIICSIPALFSNEKSDSWKLVWQDEFEKEGLPDKKKWTYETGFVRNKEEQYYTKNKSKNARVEKGSLIIEAHKEKVKNTAFKSVDHKQWQLNRPFAEYSSACIITEGQAGWQYGKIEIRAKLPQGEGVWPAFWMMGTNANKIGWPRCGEIDIMEYVHETPKTLYSTIHWPNMEEKKEKPHSSKHGSINSDTIADWHTYTMEWNEKDISFFLDDKLFFKTNLDIADGSVEKTKNNPTGNPFRQPFYLLINFAIGGGWGGKVNPAIFPQRLEVDYVRVYQKETTEKSSEKKAETKKS